MVDTRCLIHPRLVQDIKIPQLSRLLSVLRERGLNLGLHVQIASFCLGELFWGLCHRALTRQWDKSVSSPSKHLFMIHPHFIPYINPLLPSLTISSFHTTTTARHSSQAHTSISFATRKSFSFPLPTKQENPCDKPCLLTSLPLLPPSSAARVHTKYYISSSRRMCMSSSSSPSLRSRLLSSAEVSVSCTQKERHRDPSSSACGRRWELLKWLCCLSSRWLWALSPEAMVSYPLLN